MVNFIPQTPVESLYSNSTGVWDSLRSDKLEKELILRRIARSLLDKQYHTPQEQLMLYRTLTTLLSYNSRLALYLPLNLIPSFNQLRSEQIVDDFVDQYVHCWYNLLSVVEPFANYTNGDLHITSETQYTAPAALLAKALYQKGLISNSAYHMSEVTQQFMQEINIKSDDKRSAWLEWEKRRLDIKRRGLVVATHINELPEFNADDIDNAHVMLTAIDYAIENSSDYLSLLSRFFPVLMTALDDPRHCEIAEIVFKRLHGRGMITDLTLKSLGVNPINLSGPLLSQNLNGKAHKLAELDKLIRSDAELMGIIYPVAVIYGSNLKGYARRNSDLDFAVLIRSDINPDRRNTVEQILKSKLSGCAQFWLTQNTFGELSVYDFGGNEPHSMTPFDIHTLLTGVWIGNELIQEHLCQFLLKPLSKANSKMRQVIYREMERDLLQYRLLHRGYETYYDTVGLTFLDDGYRLAATKLALSNVILP